MFYFVKSPAWFQWIYPDLIWKIPVKEKVLYLTFDDGPHPEATPFVLDQLKKYDAKATFFCLGKNMLEHPVLYKRILLEGHATGNHTHDHLNGRKVNDQEYFENIKLAAEHIHSNLFRPPYGRIRKSQADYLKKRSFKIIMWSVLSGDFDLAITAKKCADNVIKHAGPGSLIVFHDSRKAFHSLKDSLPVVLNYFSEKGYQFRAVK